MSYFLHSSGNGKDSQVHSFHPHHTYQVKILRFSHDYLFNTGGLMTHLRSLNEALVRIGQVQVLQTFLVGENQMKILRDSGKVEYKEGKWLQPDTPIRLFPCVVPMQTEGRTDMDSSRACSSFGRHLEKLLQQERPEILHVHLVRHRMQLVALQLARLRGISTVLTHHEGRPSTPEMSEILEEAIQLSDRTCAVSSFSASALGATKIDYQGFFVDQEFWNPTMVNCRDVESWKQLISPGVNDRLLVFPARFIPRKNHEFLIHGMKRLIDSHNILKAGLHIHLVLPGPTLPENRPLRSHLETLVSDLELSKNVTFMDTLEPTDLRSLYLAADIIVYPALNEGAGRSHLEGMLLGCCPVVANDAGLVEHVQNGVNGITFSPDQVDELVYGLESVLLHEDQRESLASTAQATATRLTLDRYAGDHMELYRSLIDVDSA